MRTLNTRIYAVLFATITLVAGLTQPAFSAGGGGGGGSVSTVPSGPKYDPVVEYQKGLDALKANDNKAAEKAFKRVLKVVKRDANSNYLLGLALMNQGKYKNARTPFKRAVKYDENNVLARGYLAKAYRFTKKDKKAAQEIAKLEELNAACNGCEAAATIARALEIAAEAEQSDKDLGLLFNSNSGVQNYLSAVNKINRAEYKQALSELSRSAIATGPHPDILTYQGFANRKLGNRDTALRFYKSALAVDDKHRGANEYLGEYYVEIDRLDLAKAQLQKLNRICAFGCEEAEELERWIEAAKS